MTNKRGLQPGFHQHSGSNCTWGGDAGRGLLEDTEGHVEQEGLWVFELQLGHHGVAQGGKLCVLLFPVFLLFVFGSIS